MVATANKKRMQSCMLSYNQIIKILQTGLKLHYNTCILASCHSGQMIHDKQGNRGLLQSYELHFVVS